MFAQLLEEFLAPCQLRVREIRRALYRQHAARRLEEKVLRTMGESQTPAALDLLELAEFAWHDRNHELGLPEKMVVEILDGSDCQLAKMITLIRAKLEDQHAMACRDRP